MQPGRKEGGGSAVLLGQEGPRVWDAPKAVPPCAGHCFCSGCSEGNSVYSCSFKSHPESEDWALWGVRPFLQAGLGEESPSQICNVDKSIPRDGKVQ